MRLLGQRFIEALLSHCQDNVVKIIIILSQSKYMLTTSKPSDRERKLLRCTSLWYCLLCCKRWFQLLSLWMKSYGVTIQMKATEQYFPVVLFIVLYGVVLRFIL